jgi:class 3 adenylate cyclase
MRAQPDPGKIEEKAGFPLARFLQIRGLDAYLTVGAFNERGLKGPDMQPPYINWLGDVSAMEKKMMQKSNAAGFQTPPENEVERVLIPTNDNGDEPARLEIAHVLFMDIVGYSKLHTEQQTALRQQLKTVVRNTSEYKRAQKNRSLISRSTGDGMALVFFGDPEAPARCALELGRALRRLPQLPLRMGLHSGPVFRDMDMNDQTDVAGGGINMAQRVMDCGDANHILVSRSMAETLIELSQWENYLHDLGRVKVKHGKLVHVFNLYDGEFGNAETPEKCLGADTSPSTLVLNAEQLARALEEQKLKEAYVSEEVTAYREPRQSTHFIECVSDDLKGNRIFYLPNADISVYEDATGEKPKYVAWNGTAGDKYRNHLTPSHAILDEAVDEAIGLRYSTEESDLM